MNALHLHLRLYGVLEIARRHPRLFSRLVERETPRPARERRLPAPARAGAMTRDRRLARVASAAAALVAGAAGAASIDTGNPDLSLRWDTSVKYGLAGRLACRR